MSTPEPYPQKKWEVCRLAVRIAYKNDKFVPRARDHSETEHLLSFLIDCFQSTTVKDQNQDKSIQYALYALARTADPATIATLKSPDPNKPLFVQGIQSFFHEGRPSDLRKAALLFLPLVCDGWFSTRSPIKGQKQMGQFCRDWASAVDSVGQTQTPDVKEAILTVLLKMINSSRWCRHIVPKNWELLRDLTPLPDDFPLLLSCINNLELMNVIKTIDNPLAFACWAETLWLKYTELTPDVREQLEAVTKETAKKEPIQHFETSQSRIDKHLSTVRSELGRAEETLKLLPTSSVDPAYKALVDKVRSLGGAVKALEDIRLDRTATGPKA